MSSFLTSREEVEVVIWGLGVLRLLEDSALEEERLCIDLLQTVQLVD